MTTIRDYLDSIRTSLNEIEQLTDADQEPEISCNEISIRSLDSMAASLAARYRLMRNGRGKRVSGEAVSP